MARCQNLAYFWRMIMQNVVNVINISNRILNFENGKIEPGEEGLATLAESQNHYAYIEVIKDEPEPVLEPVLEPVSTKPAAIKK